MLTPTILLVIDPPIVQDIVRVPRVIAQAALGLHLPITLLTTHSLNSSFTRLNP